VSLTPTHRREQVQRFGNMRQDHQHQRSGSKELQHADAFLTRENRMIENTSNTATGNPTINVRPNVACVSSIEHHSSAGYDSISFRIPAAHAVASERAGMMRSPSFRSSKCWRVKS
jgi:hypothetical protein